MEVSEYILIGVGTCLSVLGYFLKKESHRLSEVKQKLETITVQLAQNDVRDTERWSITDKRLEDRRNDVRKLYDMLQAHNFLGNRDK
jgi:hypothetical protein